MTFKKISTWTVAVTFLVCVAVALSTGSVVAEDEPGIEVSESNVTVDNETTYSEEIDPNTRLVEYEYDDDREGFVLVFETDRRTSITLTEAVQFEEGSGSGRIYQQRLPTGTSEVFVSVPRRGGEAAVTMTTPASIEQNTFSFVSTGEASPDRPPISYQNVQILLIMTAVGSVAGTIRIVRKRQEDEDKTAEKIL